MKRLSLPSEMSAAEYRELAGEPKRSKYGAKRMCVDGMWFDSIAEGKFYGTLQLRKRAGEIGSICHSRCAEANRMGRASHGPSWGRDIDPCVNDGEVCQGCIVRAAEMDT